MRKWYKKTPVDLHGLEVEVLLEPNQSFRKSEPHLSTDTKVCIELSVAKGIFGISSFIGTEPETCVI